MFYWGYGKKKKKDLDMGLVLKFSSCLASLQDFDVFLLALNEIKCTFIHCRFGFILMTGDSGRSHITSVRQLAPRWKVSTFS